ncbi:MAG TPA: hypothetical protein VHE35_19170 [Kofleriaceae bacterium]|nr:hypothetical protein [Kofleriaceae bacterium]
MARGRSPLVALLLVLFFVAAATRVVLACVRSAGMGVTPGFYVSLAVGGALGAALGVRATRASVLVEAGGGALLHVVILWTVPQVARQATASWSSDPSAMAAQLAMIGGLSCAAATGGALVARRVAGVATQGALAWLVYVTVATIGTHRLAAEIAHAWVRTGARADAGTTFAVLGASSLAAGLVTGAAAPRRILVITLAGSIVALGVVTALSFVPPSHAQPPARVWAFVVGIVIVGAGCGLVAMLASAIGWQVGGKRRAREPALAETFA